MSSKTEQAKNSSLLKPIEAKPKLIMSKRLMEYINFLHNQASIRDREWSGYLVWRFESVDEDDLSNTVIVAEDMYLMDINTEKYTEYSYASPDLFKLMNQYPNLRPTPTNEDTRWRIGHIHTHHKMKAYFSEVDIQELEDNGPNHVYYLSLIVNYENLPVAKLTIRAKQNRTPVVINSPLKVKDFVVPEKIILFTLDLKIEQEEPPFLIERFEEVYKIRKEAEEEAKKIAEEKAKSVVSTGTGSYKNPYTNPNSNYNGYGGAGYNTTPYSPPKHFAEPSTNVTPFYKPKSKMKGLYTQEKITQFIYDWMLNSFKFSEFPFKEPFPPPANKHYSLLSLIWKECNYQSTKFKEYFIENLSCIYYESVKQSFPKYAFQEPKAHLAFITYSVISLSLDIFRTYGHTQTAAYFFKREILKLFFYMNLYFKDKPSNTLKEWRILESDIYNTFDNDLLQKTVITNLLYETQDPMSSYFNGILPKKFGNAHEEIEDTTDLFTTRTQKEFSNK